MVVLVVQLLVLELELFVEQRRPLNGWLSPSPVLSNVTLKKYKNRSGGHAGHDSMHLKKDFNNHNFTTWEHRELYCCTDVHWSRKERRRSRSSTLSILSRADPEGWIESERRRGCFIRHCQLALRCGTGTTMRGIHAMRSPSPGAILVHTTGSVLAGRES